MRDPRRTSRAWAVLAVSLALMALVTTLTSSAAHGRARPAGTHRLLSAGRPPPSLRPSLTTTHARAPALDHVPGIERSRPTPVVRTETAHPSHPRGLAPPVTSTPRAPSDHEAGSQAAIATISATQQDATVSSSTGGQSATVTPSPTTPTTGVQAQRTTVTVSSRQGSTSTHSTGAGTAAASIPPSTATVPPGKGLLDAQHPSAAFHVTGGGIITTDAIWSGTATLLFSLACPNGVSTSRIGTSGISIELDDANGGSGPCTVTIALPAGSAGSASFTISVEPSFARAPASTSHAQP